ncbi:hypothetical protein IQ07DRAFT_581774 [Pyrenochaeta sp. DS3sAY3a]|nr:hypothetical protein IQ07DRAFT_581774 [Pyrenochaeta sp. DS3sAY3a]
MVLPHPSFLPVEEKEVNDSTVGLKKATVDIRKRLALIQGCEPRSLTCRCRVGWDFERNCCVQGIASMVSETSVCPSTRTARFTRRLATLEVS